MVSGETKTSANNHSITHTPDVPEKLSSSSQNTLDLFKQDNCSNQSSLDCERVLENTKVPKKAPEFNDKLSAGDLTLKYAAQDWKHHSNEKSRKRESKVIPNKLLAKSNGTVTSLQKTNQLSPKREPIDPTYLTQNLTRKNYIPPEHDTGTSGTSPKEKPKQAVLSGISNHSKGFCESDSLQKCISSQKLELTLQLQTHICSFIPKASSTSPYSKEVEFSPAMLSYFPVSVTIGSWTRYQDAQGRLYYHNPVQGRSQWEPPEEFHRDSKDSFEDENKDLREQNKYLLKEQENLWNEIQNLKFSLEKLLEDHTKIMIENAQLRQTFKSDTKRGLNVGDKTSDMSRKLNRALTSVCQLSPSGITDDINKIIGKPKVFDSPERKLYVNGYPDITVKTEDVKLEASGKSYSKREYRSSVPREKSHVRDRQHKRVSDVKDIKMAYLSKSSGHREEDLGRRTKKRKREPPTLSKRKYYDPISLKRARYEIKCKWGSSCRYKKCWFWHPTKVKSKRRLPIFAERKYECEQCGERFRFRESLKDHLHKHKDRVINDKKYLGIKSYKTNDVREDKITPKPGIIVESIVLDEEEEDRRAKRRIKFGRKELVNEKDAEETVEKIVNSPRNET